MQMSVVTWKLWGQSFCWTYLKIYDLCNEDKAEKDLLGHQVQSHIISDISSTLSFRTVSVSTCEWQNKDATAQYPFDEDKKAWEMRELVSLKPEVKYLAYMKLKMRCLWSLLWV